MSVPVLCRAAWGASPAAPYQQTHRITQVTIHHTAVPLHDDRLAPSRLRQHQRYHQEQGWADIAYHLGVDRLGNVYDLRDTSVPGDTFTDYDPAGHLLLVAEGEYGQQQPTDAMLESLSQLVAWSEAAFGAGSATLSGHREHAATSCPGDNLQRALPAIAERARQLGSVQTRSWCDEAAHAHVAAIEAGET